MREQRLEDSPKKIRDLRNKMGSCGYIKQDQSLRCPVFLEHFFALNKIQWPFQEPKLEVPTIHKAYISGLNFREYLHKIWPEIWY
jgi:hypothetical protein